MWQRMNVYTFMWMRNTFCWREKKRLYGNAGWTRRRLAEDSWLWTNIHNSATDLWCVLCIYKPNTCNSHSATEKHALLSLDQYMATHKTPRKKKAPAAAINSFLTDTHTYHTHTYETNLWWKFHSNNTHNYYRPIRIILAIFVVLPDIRSAIAKGGTYTINKPDLRLTHIIHI